MISFAGAGAGQAQEAASAQAPAAANEWTTWGYDQERTAWNRGERTLDRKNVSKLKLQWSTKLSTPVTDVVLSTLTSPIIAAGVPTPQGPRNLVYLLGADDTLFALDADTGAIAWQKNFPNPIRARKNATWLCPNTANATPVVDKARGLIFFIPSDGKLRALDLGDGAERMAPVETVAPFTRAWSLNLIDDIVYTTSGRACGEVQDPRSAMASAVAPIVRRGAAPAGPSVMTDPSAVTAVDVRDLASPQLTRFYTSGGRPAAPWGRGGLARGPGNTVIFETSDGVYDPAAGSWGDTIMKLTPKATRVADSFTPENFKYIFAHDLAGSASPVVFPFGGKTLVATAQKEGILYLLDTNDMGGGQARNHQIPLYKSPQLGNDVAAGTDPSQGVWGAITTYENPEGKRYLYLPMWGPRSRFAPAFKSDAGESPNGSIMAFQVVNDGDKISLSPEWISGNMIMPDPPVVANGVVYATQTGGQAMQNPTLPDGSRLNSATAASARFRSTPVGNMILYAFDAETGKQLYSSKDMIKDWTHFSQPVVALGKVYLVSHDARVYALGVRK
ncbi:PQQ-binding-like beta-propeller repeat protein [Sphingomonas sp. QA11]|uniref:outer membrane protein assembly factor BamB family protein n=1 Tax=Sphingomonas sp. QA11 TaxID=2950605 RepID=UPI002349BFAF|nr:PQQ-binding-like beta-propeller repeat protein [Sphingomonas sp. QA11]WCM28931.1 PQQ-binding-like beta-propeller repeat protein [Sphingomonas sp. QA11]